MGLAITKAEVKALSGLGNPKSGSSDSKWAVNAWLSKMRSKSESVFRAIVGVKLVSECFKRLAGQRWVLTRQRQAVIVAFVADFA